MKHPLEEYTSLRIIVNIFETTQGTGKKFSYKVLRRLMAHSMTAMDFRKTIFFFTLQFASLLRKFFR